MKRILSLWLTVVIVLVPWVAFGQESEPPPPSQVVDRLQDTWIALMAMLERRPELYPLIIWPVVTAVVSFAQDAIKARAPMVWSLLQKTGLDLLGFLRLVWPKNAPKLPPPAGPAALLLLIVVLGGVQAGCAASEKLIETLHDVEDLNDAQTSIAEEAKPCFESEANRDEAACAGDAACVAKVHAKANARADLLDLAHAKQCKLNPLLVGCKPAKVPQ